MKTAPPLMATLMVASALTACSKPEDNGWNQGNAARYCVDTQNRRVPDDQCNTRQGGGIGANPFLWYYLGSMASRSTYVPAYGGSARDGSTVPTGGVRYSSVPSAFSGTRASNGVTRGVFGATADGRGIGE